MKLRLQYYHYLWALLFLAWLVAYVDRTLMTPVITWMIDNNVSFFTGVKNPYGLGGLIGGLFFSGYMLMQFPAGYLGDKHGNKVIVVLSIMWAAVATFLTGLSGTLFIFVALRVLTGLGEGSFYSNDRTLITLATPPKLRALGLGIVITGLTTGMTIALVTGAWTVEWAAGVWGNEVAWRIPFFIWAAITVVVGVLMLLFIKHRPTTTYEDIPFAKPSYSRGFVGMIGYAVVFLIVVMAIYWGATEVGLNSVIIAAIEIVVALAMVAFIYSRKKEEVAPVLKNRNLFLLYLSFIPILYSLWFYGYWSVALVGQVAGVGLIAAALTAAFNGIAGIIGFPVGGWLSDVLAERGQGRKPILMVLTALHAIFMIVLGLYVVAGGSSVYVMAAILFMSGLFFFALQPVSHAMVADLAPPAQRGAAFGMYNLIAEIGAVLSPVISGALRDVTGGWSAPIFLDGVLVAISVAILIGVRETVRSSRSRPDVEVPVAAASD